MIIKNKTFLQKLSAQLIIIGSINFIHYLQFGFNNITYYLEFGLAHSFACIRESLMYIHH